MSEKTVKDYGTQTAFLTANSTLTDGKRTVTRAVFQEFMEQEGVSRAVLDHVAEADKTLFAAASEVATADLVAEIAKARAAGDAADGLRSRIVVSSLGGSIDIEAQARRDYPNRFAKDEKGNPIADAVSTKFGVLRVRIDADKRIPGSVVDKAATLVEKALQG